MITLPMACWCAEMDEIAVMDLAMGTAPNPLEWDGRPEQLMIERDYPAATDLSTDMLLGALSYSFTVQVMSDEWVGVALLNEERYNGGEAIKLFVEGDSPRACLAALFQWVMENEPDKLDGMGHLPGNGGWHGIGWTQEEEGDD